MKTCRKCGALFEGKACLACKKRLNNAWVEKNRAKVNSSAAMRRALNPERTKEIQNKSNLKRRGKRQVELKKWREQNPEKIKEQRRKWYANNKDKVKKSVGKYRSKNLDKIKAAKKRWSKLHPEIYRIAAHNRRARIKQNGGRLSNGLAEKLFKLQRGMCACCGLPLGDNYHLDHRMPLALGGENVDSNMQLLRFMCNVNKGAKHPIEFMQSRGFLL